MRMRATFEYEVNPLDYSVEYATVESQDRKKICETLMKYARLHVDKIQVEKIHATPSPTPTPVEPR